MNKQTREQYSFEIIVSLILLLVFLLVAGTGILSYFRLDHIIDNVKTGIRPDRKLILVKEITNDLSEAENSVKSYSLTRDMDYMSRFYRLTEITGGRFEELQQLVSPGDPMTELIDSLDILVEEKFTILDRLLVVQDEFRVQQAMNRLMQSLQEEEMAQKKELETTKETDEAIVRETKEPADIVVKDTIITYPEKPAKKENFFTRLFRKKDRKPVVADTLVIIDTIHAPEPLAEQPEPRPIEQISRQVKRVRLDALTRENVLRQEEWILLQQDRIIMVQIRDLLGAMESLEASSQEAATRNAEQKAGEVKLILLAFGISASLLLFLTALVIYRYVRRNNEYGRVLKRARDEAEELAKAKERFLANMSHEIRTPMNIIAGFTGQLLGSPLEPEQREQLEMVRKSSDHLLQILNDLLDLSKLQAGKMGLLDTDFSPAEVVSDMKNWLEPAALKKHIVLEASVDDSLPPMVHGDPVRLRQILFNLAGNAVKFTEQGKVIIRAYPGKSGNNKISVIFEVTDTGIGIPGNDLEKIFEEFEQGGSPAGRNAGGTGLGLAITRRLVDLFGGKLEVGSKLGAGTTFKAEIPFEQARNAPSRKKEPLSGMEILKELRVLIVDDEEYNLRLLKAILGKFGCHCLEARSGEEALEVLDSYVIDLVLMDIRLPGISGTETARRIKEDEPRRGRKIAVIAVSAAVTTADIAEFRKYGMDDVLPKPFEEESLMRKLMVVASKKTRITDIVPRHLETKKPGSQVQDVGSHPVFDLGPLRETSEGDMNFFREMLTLFIQDTEEGLQMLTNLLEKKEWERAADLIHKISAPCRHLKAEILYGLLKEAEITFRETGDGTGVDRLVTDAKKEFEKIRHYIQSSYAG